MLEGTPSPAQRWDPPKVVLPRNRYRGFAIDRSMELDLMRYELTDHEWFAIHPLLPNKPRGVPRVDDRRTLNGIFWVLRSGAPWRDLPSSLGPYTTSYNRFVRWRRAGVWSRIMRAL